MKFQGLEDAIRILSGNVLNKIRDGDARCLVYFDPDVDGLFAGVLPYHYIVQKTNVHPDIMINENRGHGFLLEGEELNKYVGGLIIAVDFMMTRKEIQTLVNKGIHVVSIDHHENEPDHIYYKAVNRCEGVVINNQFKDEDPRYRFLSGAGMVYEVFKEFWRSPRVSNFLPVVGVTLLSDSRELGTDESRKYLEITYNATKSTNPYIRYLIEEVENKRAKKNYNFGVSRLDEAFINFTLSPTLNSLVRFNYNDVAIDFVLGRGLQFSMQEEQKKLRNAIIENSLTVAKIGSNLVIGSIDRRPYPYVNIDNFIGLVANHLVSTYNTEAVVFAKGLDGKISRASFRTNKNGIDFRKEFERIGFDARGHAGAFGIKNLMAVKDGLNEVSRFCDSVAGMGIPKQVMNVKNLHSFNVMRAKGIAEENSFVNHEHKLFLRYTGTNAVVEKGGANYQVWKVDGVKVLNFDMGISPLQGGLISVGMQNGGIAYYLERDDSTK